MSPSDKDTSGQFETGSAQNQPVAQPQLVYPAYFPGQDDDEIDLFELFAAIWRRRVFIIATTFLFALASICYVLLIATPTYEVQARLRQPADSSLVQLTNNNLLDLDKAVALERFQSELESRELLRTQFDDLIKDAKTIPWSNAALEDDRSLDQLFIEDFLPRLSVKRETGGKNKELTEAVINILFTAQNPVAGAQLINQIITAADIRATNIAKEEYSSRLREQIQQKEGELQRSIETVKGAGTLKIKRLEEQVAIKRSQLLVELDALRSDASQRHLDAIKRFEESISIAKSLGIDDPVDFTDLQTQRSASDSNSSVRFDIDEQPLYFRGTKLLNAELQVLKSRPDDELMSSRIRDTQRELKILDVNPQIEALQNRTDYLPFAEGAEELQSEIDRLNALQNRTMDSVSFVRVDLPAIPPARAVAPKKKLIVVAATVAGGMFAVVIALILNMRDNRRRERETIA